MTERSRTLILLAALAALAFPAWCFVAWTIVFQGEDRDQASRVAEFMSNMPPFLPDPSAATLLALLCSLVGLLTGIVCVRGSRGFVKRASILAIVLGAQFACLLVFSLM